MTEAQIAAVAIVVRHAAVEVNQAHLTAINEIGNTLRAEFNKSVFEINTKVDRLVLDAAHMQKTNEKQESYINDFEQRSATAFKKVEEQVAQGGAAHAAVVALKAEIEDADLRLHTYVDGFQVTMGKIQTDSHATLLNQNGLIATAISDMRTEFVSLRAGFAGDAMGAGAFGRAPPREHTPKSLVDSRDYKVGTMPENCNTEQFKKWRHDVLVFMESHAKWTGAKKLLDEIRKEVKEVNNESFDRIVKKFCSDGAAGFGDITSWTFPERSRELYQLISVKINSGLFADTKNGRHERVQNVAPP